MDIDELKVIILEILNEIEEGRYPITWVNDKVLPIIILFIAEKRTMRACFDDMKEAIKQLETAEEIMVFPPDLTLLRLLEALGCSTNEKGIFIRSYIMKANKELLKVYKKFKG